MTTYVIYVIPTIYKGTYINKFTLKNLEFFINKIYDNFICIIILSTYNPKIQEKYVNMNMKPSKILQPGHRTSTGF